MYYQRLILFDSHVTPCQLLVCDLAVTCHVAIDAQSNQSANECGEEKFSIDVCKIIRFMKFSFEYHWRRDEACEAF